MGGSKAKKEKKGSGGAAQASSNDAPAQQKTLIEHMFSPLGLIGAFIAVYMSLKEYIFPDVEPPKTGPQVYGIRVVNEYPHDPKAFTQGLLWLNGSLYESIGLYGQSAVREVRLEDGQVVREAKNGPKDFAEGLVHWNGELLQLLWRVNRGERFSAKAGEGGHLNRTSQGFKTPLKDGWGFETDGKNFIATDSGPDIYFLDPYHFKLRRKIKVKDDGRPVEMVNEMEFIDGEIWANVFGTECIARISPKTGEVLSWVVLEGMLRREEADAEAKRAGRDPTDVLNGIAWDAEGQRLFVTGKLWPKLFEIELVEPAEGSGVTLEYARTRCIPEHNIFRRQEF